MQRHGSARYRHDSVQPHTMNARHRTPTADAQRHHQRSPLIQPEEMSIFTRGAQRLIRQHGGVCAGCTINQPPRKHTIDRDIDDDISEIWPPKTFY
ncbi:hypothetical protein AVEN_65940-1 [Araneus ventricosus]|uniref:Uncharacterized protein n=1 Tax=Araneus ventricosus TaxID=182803 RepID=A0A4Y2F4T9_ARAVE|nr:hypothetical protein AVEN_65940-1 [Araneus ventricosus]